MVTAYGFAEYGGPETQIYVDVTLPPPGAGQLQVSVRAAGVNPADWKVRAGDRKGTVAVTLPGVLGREVSGVVTAVGAQVTEFRIGDEVFGATASGFGGYTESTLLDAASTAHKPASVSWADAAVLTVSAGTAYDALHDLDLPAGSTLLLLGAGGGVGVSTLALARPRGIEVIGVASEAKKSAVEAAGARWVRSGVGFTDRIAALMPHGVDALFDLVGESTLVDAATLVRAGGPIVSIADPSTAGRLGGGGVNRRRTTAVFAEVAALVATGALDPGVGARYPFTEAGAALAAVEDGHHGGKVVIEFP
ncbi:NADPH:quinone reductase-like Zn-dependent oxidoreductase [Rhodococcus sp. 27YEA15]|uniref:NADP-dependent oxidoreductase n=1 Tax=Rhodococcus sp. 27YEA15 TaxID=3156259 RepID=UPI003C7D2D93